MNVEHVRVRFDKSGLRIGADSTEERSVALLGQTILAVPKVSLEGDDIPASELALRGYVLEFTSPNDGSKNVMAFQFNSTGEAIKSMTFYRDTAKVWQARMEWTPSDDLMVAYNIVQDLYVDDAVVEETSDNYNTSNGAAIPKPLLYEIPYRTILTESHFLNATIGNRRKFVSVQDLDGCTNADAHFIGDLALGKFNSMMLRRAGLPDGPMSPLDIPGLAHALTCAIQLGRTQLGPFFATVHDAQSTAQNFALGQGMITAVIAAGWIHDSINRIPTPNNLFSQTQCVSIFSQKVCEWVSARMTM